MSTAADRMSAYDQVRNLWLSGYGSKSLGQLQSEIQSVINPVKVYEPSGSGVVKWDYNNPATTAINYLTGIGVEDAASQTGWTNPSGTVLFNTSSGWQPYTQGPTESTWKTSSQLGEDYFGTQYYEPEEDDSLLKSILKGAGYVALATSPAWGLMGLGSLGVGGTTAAGTGAAASTAAGASSLFEPTLSVFPAAAGGSTWAGTTAGSLLGLGKTGASFLSNPSLYEPLLDTGASSGGSSWAGTGVLSKDSGGGILDILSSNLGKTGLFGVGTLLDAIVGNKKSEAKSESAQQLLDMISGNQEAYQTSLNKSYMNALEQLNTNWDEYINKSYEDVKAAATPDVEGYTTALQGIISEQSEAAKRKAAASAAAKGTGGGSYGQDVEQIRREGNESIARNLLSLYSGYDLPMPEIKPVLEQPVADTSGTYSAGYLDILNALNQTDEYSWLENLLGVGGQLLSTSVLADILKGM